MFIRLLAVLYLFCFIHIVSIFSHQKYLNYYENIINNRFFKEKNEMVHLFFDWLNGTKRLKYPIKYLKIDGSEAFHSKISKEVLMTLASVSGVLKNNVSRFEMRKLSNMIDDYLHLSGYIYTNVDRNGYDIQKNQLTVSFNELTLSDPAVKVEIMGDYVSNFDKYVTTKLVAKTLQLKHGQPLKWDETAWNQLQNKCNGCCRILSAKVRKLPKDKIQVIVQASLLDKEDTFTPGVSISCRDFKKSCLHATVSSPSNKYFRYLVGCRPASFKLECTPERFISTTSIKSAMTVSQIFSQWSVQSEWRHKLLYPTGFFSKSKIEGIGCFTVSYEPVNSDLEDLSSRVVSKNRQIKSRNEKIEFSVETSCGTTHKNDKILNTPITGGSIHSKANDNDEITGLIRGRIGLSPPGVCKNKGVCDNQGWRAFVEVVGGFDQTVDVLSAITDDKTEDIEDETDEIYMKPFNKLKKKIIYYITNLDPFSKLNFEYFAWKRFKYEINKKNKIQKWKIKDIFKMDKNNLKNDSKTVGLMCRLGISTVSRFRDVTADVTADETADEDISYPTCLGFGRGEIRFEISEESSFSLYSYCWMELFNQCQFEYI
eukprot:GHVL01002894.1.p1 GENE.GHVL01002894.1~~GHVL01002894.1.p1  ORF type:complete len:598 (+),score=171.84 GHVL01002894.1:693-2486(+)